MLSDEEKREMLEDAKSESRRKAFAEARSRVLNSPVSAEQYMSFLQSVQHLFPQVRVPNKIEGKYWRL